MAVWMPSRTIECDATQSPSLYARKAAFSCWITPICNPNDSHNHGRFCFFAHGFLSLDNSWAVWIVSTNFGSNRAPRTIALAANLSNFIRLFRDLISTTRCMYFLMRANSTRMSPSFGSLPLATWFTKRKKDEMKKREKIKLDNQLIDRSIIFVSSESLSTEEIPLLQ